MRKYIPTILLVVLLGGWALFFDRVTDHLIFEPTNQVYTLQLPFEEVTFPAKNGQKLHALYLPAKEDKPTILFFHGNKYNVYSFQDFARPYAEKGYGVFLFDYRGYGKSEGSPSESHLYEDGSSALFHLMLKEKIFPQDIVLWGFSLGNAPALYVASTYDKLPFKGVILQSPFTNMADMGFYMLSQRYDGTAAATILPIFLKPLLWHKNFDNTRLIGRVRAPMLIGFSRLDRTIPWTMSRALAAKSPRGTQQFLSPAGTHHSFEWFESEALRFLESLDNGGKSSTPASVNTTPAGKS